MSKLIVILAALVATVNCVDWSGNYKLVKIVQNGKERSNLKLRKVSVALHQTMENEYRLNIRVVNTMVAFLSVEGDKSKMSPFATTLMSVFNKRQRDIEMLVLKLGRKYKGHEYDVNQKQLKLLGEKLEFVLQHQEPRDNFPEDVRPPRPSPLPAPLPPPSWGQPRRTGPRPDEDLYPMPRPGPRPDEDLYPMPRPGPRPDEDLYPMPRPGPRPDEDLYPRPH